MHDYVDLTSLFSSGDDLMKILKPRPGKPLVVSLNTKAIEILTHALYEFAENHEYSCNLYTRCDAKGAQTMADMLRPECPY